MSYQQQGAAYRDRQILTASPARLVVLVYEHALASLLRARRAVQTGNLSINSGSSVHLEAPFGGVKKSGLGRELGLQALDAYTEWKTVYIDVT